MDTQLIEQTKTQIDKMIKEGYDQWSLEKKYYEMEKNFKETLIQYMPIDRALKFVETIVDLKSAARPIQKTFPTSKTIIYNKK